VAADEEPEERVGEAAPFVIIAAGPLRRAGVMNVADNSQEFDRHVLRLRSPVRDSPSNDE